MRLPLRRQVPKSQKPQGQNCECSLDAYISARLAVIGRQRRHLRGAGGPLAPPRKNKKEKKKRKKKKKEKKRKKKKERKKETMNNVKLLHIKCCFFQFFNSPVALKNKKKFCPPRKSSTDAPVGRFGVWWLLRAHRCPGQMRGGQCHQQWHPTPGIIQLLVHLDLNPGPGG